MVFNRSILNSKISAVALLGGSLALYFIWGYESLRFEHSKLLLLYSLLFGGYYVIVKHSEINENWLSCFALLLRLLLLLAIPNLSQDFYRFIWDGRLILEGINPYLQSPNELMISAPKLFPEMKVLHEGMGALSARHYSNYPPIHQLPFITAALLSKHSVLGSVVVLRLILISADFVVLVYGKKLLQKLKLKTRNIYWFILNPLVVIELTGNLHFEGLMLCFFIMALYYTHTKKWYIAAVVMAMSIAVKLIPILSLPLFLNKLAWKKSVLFYLTTGSCLILLFLPFVSVNFIDNYSSTINLWFSNFEFNASLFYLLKGSFAKLTGLRLINSMGLVVLCFTAAQSTYLLIQKRRKTSELILATLWLLCGYYFISTTVHPWYICSLLLLSVFTPYKFVLLWSYTLIFSYFAYSEFSVKESGLLLCLEYLPVFGMLIWELKRGKLSIN